jgi:hypothetical protein
MIADVRQKERTTTILHFSQANHGPWKILAQVVQYLKRQKEEGFVEGISGGMEDVMKEVGAGGKGVVAKEDLRMRSRSSLNFETISSISTLPSLTAQQADVLPAVTDCGSC